MMGLGGGMCSPSALVEIIIQVSFIVSLFLVNVILAI